MQNLKTPAAPDWLPDEWGGFDPEAGGRSRAEIVDVLTEHYDEMVKDLLPILESGRLKLNEIRFKQRMDQLIQLREEQKTLLHLKAGARREVEYLLENITAGGQETRTFLEARRTELLGDEARIDQEYKRIEGRLLETAEWLKLFQDEIAAIPKGQPAGVFQAVQDPGPGRATVAAPVTGEDLEKQRRNLEMVKPGSAQEDPQEDFQDPGDPGKGSGRSAMLTLQGHTINLTAPREKQVWNPSRGDIGTIGTE